MTESTNGVDTGPMFTVPSGAQVPIINNRIETEIVVDLCEVIDCNPEGFLDYVSEQATDTEVLTDVSYRVTGLTPEGALILTVEGDISMILDTMEDSDE